MKKPTEAFMHFVSILLTVLVVIITGCNQVQPVIIMSIWDFFGLIVIDVILMMFLSLYTSGFFGDRPSKLKFWFWFIFGIFVPPVLIIASIIKYATTKN